MKYTLMLFGLLLVSAAYGVEPINPRPDVNPPPVRVDSPKAVISDLHGNPLPEKAELGELLFFDGSGSIAGDDEESFRWYMTPDSRAERMREVNGGKAVVVSTGTKPVTIKVILMVALNNRIDYSVIEIECGVPEPTPGPGPGPNPNPTPTPTPAGDRKTRLAKLTAGFTLPTADKPKVAKALRDVASRIDNETIPDSIALLKATMDAMVAAIGLDKTLAWIPWRDAFTKFLVDLKLAGIKDHSAVWREAADVLEGK